MNTSAQKKLAAVMQARGARAVAASVGLGEKALRAIRDGSSTPREATRQRFEAIGIEPQDWTETPDELDLDEIEATAPSGDADASLLQRLTSFYRDTSRAITDRARAASIALRLCKALPSGPTAEAQVRFLSFVGELEAADPSLSDVCERHEAAVMAPASNPAAEILDWARTEAGRPDTPDRAVTTLNALEARAAAVLAATASTVDPIHALTVDLVKQCSPITPEVRAAFERYGIESRPLAPKRFNVNWPGYHALCTQNGWRPRESNDPTWERFGR